MAREDGLWFSFAGRRSSDMGVRVARISDIPVAEARGTAVEVPGRDGALWLPDDSFKDIVISIDVEIGRDDCADAAAWLSGQGDLTLSTLPDFRYEARVSKGFDLAAGVYAGGCRRATIQFSCRPFRYLVGRPEMAPITQACTFTGSGTWTARPVITVYGAGEITLMVNGASVLLDDVDDHITLDCDAMMAFRDGENASPRVTLLSEDGAWPELTPGVNAVNFSGDVSGVVIRPNWRWR